MGDEGSMSWDIWAAHKASLDVRLKGRRLERYPLAPALIS